VPAAGRRLRFMAALLHLCARARVSQLGSWCCCLLLHIATSWSPVMPRLPSDPKHITDLSTRPLVAPDALQTARPVPIFADVSRLQSMCNACVGGHEHTHRQATGTCAVPGGPPATPAFDRYSFHLDLVEHNHEGVVAGVGHQAGHLLPALADQLLLGSRVLGCQRRSGSRAPEGVVGGVPDLQAARLRQLHREALACPRCDAGAAADPGAEALRVAPGQVTAAAPATCRCCASLHLWTRPQCMPPTWESCSTSTADGNSTSCMGSTESSATGPTLNSTCCDRQLCLRNPREEPERHGCPSVACRGDMHARGQRVAAWVCCLAHLGSCGLGDGVASVSEQQHARSICRLHD
jgi:hypothetical protein